MIDVAVSHITEQLNQYLRRTYDLSEDVVVISNIVEQDGNVAPGINNKLVAFIVNIEKDTAPYAQQHRSTAGVDRVTITYPPIFVNFYLMFAGHFSGNNYREALKFISQTIGFFQRHPVFDHQKIPDLDRHIDKLILDIENLGLSDLSNLWGTLSGKYLPSILYKVRMVTYDSGDIRTQVPTVTEPQALVK